jgi:voltage-gated sodium channel
MQTIQEAGVRGPGCAGRLTLSGWRGALARMIEARAVQTVLIALILVNAAVLGLETYPWAMAGFGAWLRVIDSVILSVFVVEIAARLIAYRVAFFRDPWSVFDLAVVSVALLPASGPISVLRALRVLRVMRLMSLVPSMRRVAGGLLAAIPGLGAVIGIIAVILYVSAVVATKLFGDRFPEWFGTLGESAFTMFQLMTLEGWAEVARAVMQVYPLAWIFFLLYLLAATFTMLNLFVAVVVNAMQAEHSRGQQAPDAPARPDRDALLLEELRALRAELRELRAAVRT